MATNHRDRLTRQRTDFPEFLTERRVVDAATRRAPEDWTSFDVTQSLRVLRSRHAPQVRREMRKLHAR
eukprot:3029478-Pyramimonas_sp.AAC.1